VGSGPAGALVASELAAAGKTVAIVEAGRRIDREEQRRHMDRGTDAFLVADNDPRTHVPLTLAAPTIWHHYQIRRVGGNTQLWAGACPRGLEQQFAMKSLYGVGDDWPITYADLEPFYCQAEQELGVAGVDDAAEQPWRSQPYPLPPVVRDYSSEQFARACKVLGFSSQTMPIARTTRPYRGRPACDYASVNMCSCCPTSARYTSEGHIDQAVATRSATLLTETMAATLRLGEDGRVRELLCYRSDRSELVIRAGVFLVAGNAVGTARLLLMAQPPPGRDWVTRSAAIGRYFMGHPVYEQHAELPEPVLGARSNLTVVSRHFEDGPHIRTAAGFRMFFHTSDQTPTLHGLQLVDEGEYGAAFKRELKRRTGHRVRATVIINALARRDNGVELDFEHRDHFGLPGLSVRLVYGEYEDNGRRLGERTMARILDVLGGKQVGSAAYDVAHQLGTTRMGSDRSTSVVDANLRVHDVDNLYVAGGSVFPNGLGPTNPTLTIAALSLRLAKHLLREVLR
jgi:choline dehydrogenase-like flavoprotein